MSENYTPTTEQVRDAVQMARRPFDITHEIDDPYYGFSYYEEFVEPSSAFDRWLEAHDREVAEKALEEVKEAVGALLAAPAIYQSEAVRGVAGALFCISEVIKRKGAAL